MLRIGTTLLQTNNAEALLGSVSTSEPRLTELTSSLNPKRIFQLSTASTWLHRFQRLHPDGRDPTPSWFVTTESIQHVVAQVTDCCLGCTVCYPNE